MNLYKRKIFDKIEPYLGDETILVLIGARQVGKTHILSYTKQHLEEKGKKVIYYDLEYPELLQTFNNGVNAFLADLKSRGYIEGEDIFVFIDEIQYMENPSSFLKIVADHYKNIHLVVSGSSTFDIKTKFTNSLAGRTISFEVFPLSFEEFLMFKESEYKDISSLSKAGIDDIKTFYREFIKYGGYPKIVLETSEEKKKEHLIQLVDTYIRKDVRDLADITDINKFNSMLKVIASQSGQLLNMPSLSRETNISLPTLVKYLSILEETFVIKRVPPYSKSPSVEISKNPKIFFFDSGLLSILWLNNFQSTILGSIFETSIFGELVKKVGRQHIYFWRTKAHQEIDFVIENTDGSLLPIEAKINFQRFSSKTIVAFTKKYKIQDWKVMAMDGKKLPKNSILPWEIHQVI